MDFPPIMFTKENESDSTNTIHYVSKFNLLPTVEVIVGPTMWDHVLKSPLGVIVQFRRVNFGWSSKIVHHHLLSKQLVCENEYESWCLIGDSYLFLDLCLFQRSITWTIWYFERVFNQELLLIHSTICLIIICAKKNWNIIVLGMCAKDVQGRWSIYVLRYIMLSTSSNSIIYRFW